MDARDRSRNMLIYLIVSPLQRYRPGIHSVWREFRVLGKDFQPGDDRGKARQTV